MKLVNKGRKLKVDAFSSKTLNSVKISKIGNYVHIKCDFDNFKGQFEIVIPYRTYKDIKVEE